MLREVKSKYRRFARWRRFRWLVYKYNRRWKYSPYFLQAVCWSLGSRIKMQGMSTNLMDIEEWAMYGDLYVVIGHCSILAQYKLAKKVAQ